MTNSHPTKESVAQPSIPYQVVVTLRQSFNLTFDQIAVIMMVPVRSAERLFDRAQQLAKPLEGKRQLGHNKLRTVRVRH